MGISLVALLIIFAAVFGTAGMMGILGYFLHRIRRIEGEAYGKEGRHDLSFQLREMQEELLSVRTELSALTERLDFTEKLLMSGDESKKSDSSE